MSARTSLFFALLLAGCDVGALETYRAPETARDAGANADAENSADGGAADDAAARDADGEPRDGSVIDEDGATLPEDVVPLIAEALDELTTTNRAFDPVPGASLTFRPGRSTWIVMFSGRMRSSEDSDYALEARIMLNGLELDRFGHRTSGVTENWAGFFTFTTVPPGATELTYSMELAAHAGESAISHVRIVAFPLPEGADLHEASLAGDSLLAGDDLSLAKLEFTPASPGPYIVLARASHSTAPGAGTVQTWLVDEEGEAHPNGPEDVHYSNSTGALAPIFLASRRELSAETQTIEIKGSSSGNSPHDRWWDFNWRRARNLVVNAGDSIGVGNQFPITFDHASMVASLDSEVDGRDLRIIYDDGLDQREVPLVLDPDSAWNAPDTTVWIAAEEPINGMATDGNYRLYYGNPSVPARSDDPEDVFFFFDNFDEAQLDFSRWLAMQGATVDPLRESAIFSGDAWMIANPPALFDFDVMLEAKVKLTRTAQPGAEGVFLGMASDPLGAAGAGFGYDQDSFYVATSVMNTVESTEVMLFDPEDENIYTLLRKGDSAIEYFQNNNYLADLTVNIPQMSLAPAFRANPSASFEVFWVRVRDYLSLLPAVDVGEELGFEGAVQSRWKNVRLLAFRADVFDREAYEEDLANQQTTSPSRRARSSLNVPIGLVDRHHVFIQSMRISGQNDEPGARRSGYLIQGNETMMETSHKIDAGGDRFGYHHTVGFAGVYRGRLPVELNNSYRSVDGATVQSAESVIIVLRYPR